MSGMDKKEADKLQTMFEANLIKRGVEKGIAIVAAAHMTTYYFVMSGFELNTQEAYELFVKASGMD